MSAGPVRTQVNAELEECIDACDRCREACIRCADECLVTAGDGQVTHAFLSDLDCAAICEATRDSLLRYNGYNVGITRALVEACQLIALIAVGELQQAEQLDGPRMECVSACRRVHAACAALLARL